MTRATIFLISVFVLLFACACGPPSSDSGSSSTSASGEIPDLTDEMIRERINRTWLREVPAEDGSDRPISWGFNQDEPKEITIVDKQVEGTHATVVLDVKTGSSPRSRNKLSLAGQIRLRWELRTGWVLRTWEIVDTENISMKYKDLGKGEKNQNQNQNQNQISDPPEPPDPNGQ